MLLAVDIGNTNVNFGVFDGETLKATWRVSSDVRREPDEYAALSLVLLERKGIPVAAITDCIVCSVVPPLTPVLDAALRAYFHIAPVILGAGTRTGMRILYENPREVGADRIAHGIAAYKRYGGPVIVIDFGTATVFDAINSDGDYLGGAIAPGIVLAAEALFQRASRLPRIELGRPKQAIGRNTVASMQSGMFYGYVGLVEGLVQRFQQELGGGAKVVATGGMAQAIAQDTKVIDAIDPDLVLTGLRLLHELNASPVRPEKGAGHA